MPLPRLYTDLADWWPVLSSPAEYEEEATIFRHALEATSRIPIQSVLELGSGGGHNASWMKAWWKLTLVDVAPAMLAVSQSLNPECEHVEGDMRSLRLGRAFDAVFVHDAVSYMTSREDLRAAMETAFVHLKPGGVALFAPDDTVESFHPKTEHGGHDAGARALRYLEWAYDPDPDDDRTTSTMIYVLREEGQPVRVVEDQHEFGLFPEVTWLRTLAEVGFVPSTLPFQHSELLPTACGLFLGLKPR